MEKNNKKILPILLIFLFSVIIIFLIVWIRSKKPAVVSAPATVQTKPVQKNPNIFFASNGKNSVYKIKKGDQWSVIWNDQEGKAYDFVSNPVFSFDGTQIAYNAEINGQAYVVVNNTQEINAYQKANYITFSKDGSTIAFVATKGEQAYVVISAKISDIANTTKESQEYKKIGVAQDPSGNSSAIIMSDDGENIAYVIKENGKTYVVVNGEKGQGYDDIINFSFSEDGSSFTYEAQNGDTVLTVTDNQVVSSSTNNNPPPNSNQSNSTYQVNNYSPNPSSTYRYKISTQKDIILDQERLDYSDCASSGTCNF